VIGRRLVNGVEGAGISPDDRGFQYGDGLFETMFAVDGRVRRFDLHMSRLAEGCHRLGMPAPPVDTIAAECQRALQGLGVGVVKLVVTRGPGPRGYPPPTDPTLTRVVQSTAQAVSEAEALRPITVRVCETRLGLNPRLAGMKHLNRLEQVLAGAELREPGIDEGLMRSVDDRLVSGTASNLFLVNGERLLTPQILNCGVAGIMREVVLRAAAQLGIAVEVVDLTIADLERADELFLTNSVRGIRPVGCVDGLRDLPSHAFTLKLRQAVEAVAQ
jgi:4-amino-4-deoxychorismate lyase